MIRVRVYTTAPDLHGISWPAFPKTFEVPDEGGVIEHNATRIEINPQSKEQMENLSKKRMLITAQAHLEQEVLKDENYDILSCVFSHWEDTLVGDTVVLTVKMRRGRGDAQIAYEIWEYFFPREEEQADKVSYCRVASTGVNDAEDWRMFSMLDHARKVP